MKNKLTVTIGIPAYNEEKNIKKLINSILKQKGTGFRIMRIIVVSDASNDLTNKNVRNLSAKHKNIKLIVNRKRIGQSFSQNKIFAMANSDVVVLFEADTILTHGYFQYLLEPFKETNSLGLVQGNIKEAPTVSSFGRMMSEQKNIYHSFTMQNDNVAKYFTSGRGGRAFSKEIYRHLRWPKNIPEDVYAHLWCLQNNKKIFFAKKAVCLFKVPESIGDLFLERSKNNSGYESLKKYFPEKLINEVYHRSKLQTIKMTLMFFINSPASFFYYQLVNLLITITPKNAGFTDFWSAARSTKIL